MTSAVLGPQRSGILDQWAGRERSAGADDQGPAASPGADDSHSILAGCPGDDDSKDTTMTCNPPGSGINDQWDPDLTKRSVTALRNSGAYDADRRGGDSFLAGLAGRDRIRAEHVTVEIPAVAKMDRMDYQPSALPSGPVETVSAVPLPGRQAISSHEIYGECVPHAEVQVMDLQQAAQITSTQVRGVGQMTQLEFAHPVSASAQARASMSSFTPPMNRA